MAIKDDKKYLFRHFRCEECGKTVTGPCDCVCPHCGNMMLETMMWQCCKLLQYSIACMSAVYEDMGQVMTEEQQSKLHGSISADFLHDAKIMIDDGWSYITSDLDEIGKAVDAYGGGGLQFKNLVGTLFGIGGIALAVYLLFDDYLTSSTVILMIVSLFCIWKYGKKGALEDLRRQVSKDEVSGVVNQNKHLQRKLGAIENVFGVMMKMGTFDDDARIAAENLDPEAQELFSLIVRESKPYSKRIIEALRDGSRTVDEVVDSVFSLKRL